MAYIEHEFNGVTRRLSFTAEALYRIYDKYGYSGDLMKLLKLNEMTTEAWDNLCWIYSLLAAQGELQRRAMHEDPQPMLKFEEIKRLAMPTDIISIKTAVVEAIQQGFATTAKHDDDEEVDLVLQDMDEAEKKTAAGGVIDWLTSLFAQNFSGWAL
jgi:hypothetical protein